MENLRTLLFLLVLLIVSFLVGQLAFDLFGQRAFGAEKQPAPAQTEVPWAPLDEHTTRWKQVEKELADQAAEYQQLAATPEPETRAERQVRSAIMLRIAHALERIAFAAEHQLACVIVPEKKRPNPFLIDETWDP